MGLNVNGIDIPASVEAKGAAAIEKYIAENTPKTKKQKVESNEKDN